MLELKNTLTRRKALVVAGGAAVAAGAVLASPLRPTVERTVREATVSQPWLRGVVSLADGSYEEWLAQVGSVFALGGGLSMRLAGISALNSGGDRPGALRQRAFAAMFDPVGAATLPGDLIYTANHPQYGPLAIFLSAAPSRGAPARMLAVFN